jgi:uncharacterized protein YdaL
MFGWFRKKATEEDVERLRQAVQTGFNNVKKDFSNTSTWIKHLDSKTEEQDSEISNVYEELSSIKSEVENLKNMIDILGNRELFKQRQTVFNKQTTVQAVQTPVQTAVQTPFIDDFLNNLSVTERAIVWVLLNSGHDMKLSYDDLAAMLGKERATIRGQLNSIKQKSEGLIEEQAGKNNKKRFFIAEKMKDLMLKKVKIKTSKKGENSKNSDIKEE